MRVTKYILANTCTVCILEKKHFHGIGSFFYLLKSMQNINIIS